MQSETHRLLHKLWTKAVGTRGYNKEEWLRLEKILEERAVLLNKSSAYAYGSAGECPGFSPCYNNEIICVRCGSHEGNHTPAC